MGTDQRLHQLTVQRLDLMRDLRRAVDGGDMDEANRIRRALNRNTEQRHKLLAAKSAQRRRN
jgi:hypothetical protein